MDIITTLFIITIAMAGIIFFQTFMWSRSEKRLTQHIQFLEYDRNGYVDMLRVAIDERDELREYVAELKESRDAYRALTLEAHALLNDELRAEDGTWL